jgi:photosystem I P700 chlorophyll a apoprotein A2
LVLQKKQILIEPVFAQWIQASQGKTTRITYFYHNSVVPHIQLVNLWLPGWLEAINSNTNSLFLTIGRFLSSPCDCLGLYNNINPCKGALDAWFKTNA